MPPFAAFAEAATKLKAAEAQTIKGKPMEKKDHSSGRADL